MSSPKGATRRTSLLAGSSLAAASVISAFGLAASVMAPASAYAADECTPVPASGTATNGPGPVSDDPTLNADNPDFFSCNQASYPTGTTYDANGDLTVTTTVDAAEWGGNGIVLTATGDDSITFDTDVEIEGRNLNGALVDVSTEAGNILISTEDVDADAHSAANVTHGIRAISTTGDISITNTGIVGAGSGTSAGVAGIEARSSGDVTIDAQHAVSGRLYGILAETTGSGDLTIVKNNVSSVNGIDATTGTGFLSVDVQGTLNAGGAGSALRIDTGGDANIDITGVTRGTTNNNQPIVDMTTTAGTQTVLTHNILAGAGAGDSLALRFAIRAAGGGDLTINANGRTEGRVDFSGHTGDLDWNINNEWFSTGGVFGSGDDSIDVAEGSFLVLTHAIPGQFDREGDANTLEAPSLLDFGDGDDILVNRGILSLGNMRQQGGDDYGNLRSFESETRFVGLDTLQNNGSIVLGQPSRPGHPGTNLVAEDYYDETDLTTDDVLIMPGTRFIGGEGSRILLDVRLTGNQDACDVSLRSPDVASSGELDASMPGADCLAIPGGSTEGVTNLVLKTAALGDRGGPSRIVLVDVGGGTSEAGHFVLDPTSPNYTADQGGYMDFGYFIMPLVYDPETQQHVLVGVTGQNAWQQAAWAQSAQDLWRVSTGSWLERQADLRGDDLAGVGGGVWLRLNGQTSERDLINTVTEGASTFHFDNGYEQSSYAVTGGLDLMAGGGADSAWVVGLTAGYANAEISYAASPNTGQLDGWTGGAYATYLAGGLFVDAIVNANRLEIIADMPALNLSPAGTLLDTRLLSVGAQVEAGWRIPFAGGAFIEPLAGVSYVRTKWDEMEVPSDDLVREGVTVDFGDPTSLRGSIGARLGLDQDYGAFRAQYSLLGRVWEEFDGQADLTLGTIVDDAFVSDEFAGSMSELGVSASIAADVVSGFLNVGGKWADDYEAVGAAVGVRVAW